MDLPTVGARIRLADHFGTIRYVGGVDGTKGTWLGVEWDDPQRGRHDGCKDSKRYFTCWHPTAGSFVRPSASIAYGKSFLEALASKYIEALHGQQTAETVVLGSSQGAIIVEAVRLDKIRGKLANLERLREVSLDNEDVGRSDPAGAIRDTCPNIKSLDLSMGLIPSWDVVALIARELPALERLALNKNRLQPATDLNMMGIAFLHLTELLLNGTGTTWPEMQAITALMPNLQIVEMGYNSLAHLGSPEAHKFAPHITIRVINLDSNVCTDWIDICESLQQYKSLQRLIVTSNCIQTIPLPASRNQGLPSLKHVSLSHNKLNSWNDIEALSAWCPALETLTTIGNPITNQEPTRHARPFIIARIPSLLTLDGASISSRERNDCEIFYQSYVIRHEPTSEAERHQAHPQWARLCAKHGIPEGNVKETLSDKLSHRLISLKLHDGLIASEEKTQDRTQPFILKVLPSMTLRTLRMKLSKVLKSGKAIVLVWALETNGNLRELGFDLDPQDLDRLGMEDGSDVVFRVMKT